MGRGLDIFAPQEQPKADRGLIRADITRTGLWYGVFGYIVDKEGASCFSNAIPTSSGLATPRPSVWNWVPHSPVS